MLVAKSPTKKSPAKKSPAKKSSKAAKKQQSKSVSKARSFEVEAAGGVVVDQRSSGPRILLVHRPRYDDWSLPKGKLDPGETAREAAYREVLEETGVKCVLRDKLPEVRYIDHQGRRKRVRYWMMTPKRPVKKSAFVPNDEVDAIKWAKPGKARQMLTYRRDMAVLKDALRLMEFNGL